MPDSRSFLDGPVHAVAARLLGCELVRVLPDGRRLRGRIVETEAYEQSDEASHSYKGKTARTAVMFGPAGRLYVYFIYGLHYCCNIVSGPEGYGAAVLVRAVEPLEGADYMRQSRGGRAGQIANGPAKVCQAMNITLGDNGADLLSNGPLQLVIRPELDASLVGRTTRIGITKARDVVGRFYIKGNSSVSRPNM